MSIVLFEMSHECFDEIQIVLIFFSVVFSKIAYNESTINVH